jgi:hypothetical protein
LPSARETERDFPGSSSGAAARCAEWRPLRRPCAGVNRHVGPDGSGYLRPDLRTDTPQWSVLIRRPPLPRCRDVLHRTIELEHQLLRYQVRRLREHVRRLQTACLQWARVMMISSRFEVTPSLPSAIVAGVVLDIALI